MTNPLTARVTASFAVPEDGAPDMQAKALEYINLLMGRINDYNHIARRSLSLGLAAAALFILLQTDLAPKLSAGPIEVLSNSTLVTFLTSVFAYLVLDAMVNYSQLDRLVTAYLAAFRQWNETAADSDLDLLLMPSLPLFYAASSRSPQVKHQTGFDRTYEKIGFAFVGVIFLSPLGFEGYAFFTLFSALGVGNIAVWINLVLSAVFVVFSYVVFFTEIEPAIERA